jgi:hypothetical protein
VEERVFYTLTGEPDSPKREERQAHRNSKAIAHLFGVIVRNGALSEEQLDDLLLAVAR